MGKKKRGHPDVEEILSRPWCYYCERDFDDLKILINHQKAKHFKCERCGRRLNTAGGLSVHMTQVHKETLTTIENALPNRSNLDVEIFGMEGIPEDVVGSHNQRVISQFAQAEAERRAATGNPGPGGPGAGAAKKPKVEDPSDLKKRLAEHKAKKAAEQAAGISSGDATPINDMHGSQSPGFGQNPGYAGSPSFAQQQMPYGGPANGSTYASYPQTYGQPGMPYQQPQTFPQHNASFGPLPSAQYPTHQGYPPQQQYPPPGNPNFAPPPFHNNLQAPFQGGPPRTFGAGSPPIPFHQQSHFQPPRTQTPPQSGAPQRSASLAAAPGLPQRPSFGAPSVNAFQMQQMHQGQLPGPPNHLPALQATQSSQYGNSPHDGLVYDVSQNGIPQQAPQAQNGSSSGLSMNQYHVPQEAQDKLSTSAPAPISQATVVANDSTITEPVYEALGEAKSSGTQGEKRPKKEKEKEIKLVYSDNETSPEEKMAKLSSTLLAIRTSSPDIRHVASLLHSAWKIEERGDMDSLVQEQKRGQELYRRKDYTGALQCFDETISQWANPPLSVIDNRAATLTKLGNLPGALRDGRRMIQLGKTDATGYLRTGQVLQLMGNDDTALGIYEYGLKHVSPGDENTKLIRGMYNKLLAKCSPAKALDPLKVLPLELAEMVLQHLSFNIIVRLLRVSKDWKRLVESMPSLWRHLDLSLAKSRVSFKAIKACIVRSRGKMSHATMFRWDAGQHDALAYTTSRCKRLEYLHLRDGFGHVPLTIAVARAPTLKTLIISRDFGVSIRDVTELLVRLPHLERGEFLKLWSSGTAADWVGDLSRLRVFKLHAALDQRDGLPFRLRLDDLFPLTPNLQELSLQTWKFCGPRIPSDFSTLTELRSLSLDQVDIAVFPCLPHQLQSLTMNNAWGIGDASDLARSHADRNDFSALTSLTVSPARHLRPEVLHALVENGTDKLRTCHLSNFDAREQLPSLVTSGRLADAVDLRLSNADLTDALAESIATYCPRLRSFEASHNPKLTGVGVKALMLKEGDQLLKLNLDYCGGVGIDAVEFARSMGADVKFSLADGMKSVKRVHQW